MATVVNLAWAGFIALGGLSIFAMAVAAFRRWPAIPLYCLTFFIVTVWDLPVKPPLAHAAGTTIHIEDAIIMTAIATVLANPSPFWKTVRPYNLAILVSILCVALSLINGIVTFGAATAFNEFRSFLYPLGIVAWFLNNEWRDEAGKRRLRRWATITGILVTAVGLIHWAMYGLGKADTFVVSAVSGQEMTSRPLTSDQALILVLLGFLMFWYWGTHKSRWYPILGVAFIGMAIVAQHRSVWVALAAALVPVVFRLRGLAATRFVVGIFWTGMILTIVLLSGVLESVVESILYSSQRTGTYLGRLSSWSTLVDMAVERGPYSVIFGEPFGFGYERREMRGFMINYAPHNWYVSILLRLGLVGLILFVWILLWAFVRLCRGRDRTAALGVFAAILVYMWNYSLSWQIGVLFALALVIAAEKPTKDPAPAPRPWKKLNKPDPMGVEQQLQRQLARMERQEARELDLSSSSVPPDGNVRQGRRAERTGPKH